MSLAPEPYLSACLRVLHVATLEARLIGYGGHEHGLRGKHERIALSNQPGQTRLAEFRVERARQCLLVQTETKALLVECVDGATARHGHNTALKR